MFPRGQVLMKHISAQGFLGLIETSKHTHIDRHAAKDVRAESAAQYQSCTLRYVRYEKAGDDKGVGEGVEAE